MTTTDNLELELVSGTETFDTDKVMNNFTKIDTAVGNLQDGVGNVESLTTTAKTDLVAAINEVDGNIGDLSGLSTTAKKNLVSAVNELNQNISNCYDKNQVDGFLDGYKFRILQAQLQFANGSAIWEDDLSDLGGALYFASVNGLAVNDTFACSITNGTAASARLIVWELNTPNFSGSVNMRIFVMCK